MLLRSFQYLRIRRLEYTSTLSWIYYYFIPRGNFFLESKPSHGVDISVNLTI
jgi:hypothetical protein